MPSVMVVEGVNGMCSLIQPQPLSGQHVARLARKPSTVLPTLKTRGSGADEGGLMAGRGGGEYKVI